MSSMAPSGGIRKHATIVRDALRTLVLILCYYTFSIGITFYNKWMFSQFKFPIATTMTHFAITMVLSGLARELSRSCCNRKPVTLSWDVMLKKVMPTGIISALDIGLSNWSFMFITVSLYTMVKSSCILFILFFSLLLGLEKPRPNLIVIVFCISLGLFLFVFKSTQFNLEGFVLVLLAAFLGGARWTLSQILCQKSEIGLTNPIDAIYHLCPTMVVGLFPIFIGNETGFMISKYTFGAQSSADLAMSLSLIGLGGFLAFFLSVSEYVLLTYTSSLTLSISGIFKELVTLVIATQMGSDEISPINWVGFAICIVGIGVHVNNKYQAQKERQQTEEMSGLIANEVLQDSTSSDEADGDIFVTER